MVGNTIGVALRIMAFEDFEIEQNDVELELS